MKKSKLFSNPARVRAGKTDKPTQPRTEKQRAASRRNGAKSQGPNTENGKKASSRNAYKHGLYTSRCFSPMEEEPGYQRLLADYLAEFQPATATARHLVVELANTAAELQRLRVVHASFWEQATAEARECLSFEHPGRTIGRTIALTKAYALLAVHNTFLRLERRIERLRREFELTRDRLLKEATPLDPDLEPLTSEDYLVCLHDFSMVLNRDELNPSQPDVTPSNPPSSPPTEGKN
jgi:hypothetical protein